MVGFHQCYNVKSKPQLTEEIMNIIPECDLAGCPGKPAVLRRTLGAHSATLRKAMYDIPTEHNMVTISIVDTRRKVGGIYRFVIGSIDHPGTEVQARDRLIVMADMNNLAEELTETCFTIFDVNGDEDVVKSEFHLLGDILMSSCPENFAGKVCPHVMLVVGENEEMYFQSLYIHDMTEFF